MSQVIGSTAASFAKAWHHVDLRDKVLGRISTRIAVLLMGKHKAVYDPGNDCGDYVVVTNARHIQVTGRKPQQKLYRKHTGWRLKEVPFERMIESKPEEVIRKAVSGMLPKNKLRDRRLERLKVYADDEHPYEANIFKRYDLAKAFSKGETDTTQTDSKSTESIVDPKEGRLLKICV